MIYPFKHAKKLSLLLHTARDAKPCVYIKGTVYFADSIQSWVGKLPAPHDNLIRIHLNVHALRHIGVV